MNLDDMFPGLEIRREVWVPIDFFLFLPPSFPPELASSEENGKC